MGLLNKMKIGIVVLLLLVCSCNNKNFAKIDTSNLNVNEQIIDIPEMVISYGYGLDVPVLTDWIKSGTSSWSYFNGKDIVFFVTDSLHPLDSQNNLTTIKEANKLKISFSYEPSYYTVRYWPKKYIGDTSAYEMYFEIIDIEDNTIILPDEELGYVFEIKAVWESVNDIKNIQGYAHYAFSIKK